MYNPDGPTHSARIPTTLKQFKILARLGRTPSMSLYDDIEAGAEFYFSEEDYLSREELNGSAQPSLKKAASVPANPLDSPWPA